MELTGDVSAEASSRRASKSWATASPMKRMRPRRCVVERHGLAGFLHFLWEQPPLRTALFVTAAMLLGIAIIPQLGM